MQTAERTHSEALYFQGPLQLLGSKFVGMRERFAFEENVQGDFLQAIEDHIPGTFSSTRLKINVPGHFLQPPVEGHSKYFQLRPS